MKLTSIGPERDRGDMPHFDVPSDNIRPIQDSDGSVIVRVRAGRRYRLILKPEEIIACLLAMPAEAIPKAMTKQRFAKLAIKKLPNLVQQFVVAATADAK